MPRHPAVLLTHDQIVEVRKRQRDGESWKDLAVEFGLSADGLRGQCDPGFRAQRAAYVIGRWRARRDAERRQEAELEALPKLDAEPDALHVAPAPTPDWPARMASAPDPGWTLIAWVAGDPPPGRRELIERRRQFEVYR